MKKKDLFNDELISNLEHTVQEKNNARYWKYAGLIIVKSAKETNLLFYSWGCIIDGL